MDNVNLKSDSVSVIGSSHIPDINENYDDFSSWMSQFPNLEPDPFLELLYEFECGEHHRGMGLCYEY